MVEEVFELSKASSNHLPMKRETIDIGRLLEQTLGEMDEQLCASGFQLKKDYPLTGMLVLCDGLHMHRVFQNLFDNALKYACPQTRIFIHAIQRSDQFCEIRIRNTSRVPLDFDPEKLQNGLFAVKKPELEKEVVLVLPLQKLTQKAAAVNFILR